MLELVLLAFLAGFIALRLRAELGKKSDGDIVPPGASRRDAGFGPIVDADAKEVDDSRQVVDLVRDPDVRDGLAAIRRKDRHFEAGDFLDGAQNAYGMILEAFWEGDKATLKDFLDQTVLGQFEAAIDQREADKLVLKNKLIDITEAKISGAELKGKTAEVTVAFTAEIIAATLDANGDLVDGDLSDAIEIEDYWTFARDTSSNDPSWALIATRAG